MPWAHFVRQHGSGRVCLASAAYNGAAYFWESAGNSAGGPGAEPGGGGAAEQGESSGCG